MSIRKLLYFLFLLTGKFGLAQSDQIRFYATVQPSAVEIGQPFNLAFTLTNATGKDVIMPDLSDFTIVGGPNKSVSVQSINGDWKQVVEYSYELMPRKSGKFIIGSAFIKIKSNTLKSNPVTISVRDASVVNNPKNSKQLNGKEFNKDFFVQVIPNKNTAFIGEQVLVDFVLFTHVSVQDFQVIEEPGFTKSYAQELKFYNEPQSQQEINGKNFIRKLIKRYAVFPQEDGVIEIQPMTIEANIMEADSDPFSGFFGHETETRHYSTNQLTISGKSLPKPAPKSYIGASGNWKIDLMPTSTEISKNDALSLILTIEGDGDIKNVQFPNLVFSSDFESYPPKVIEEHSAESNGQLISKKVFEFLLVPKKIGKLTFGTELSWFDSANKQYQSKVFGPFSVTVNKSMGEASGESDNESEDYSDGIFYQLKKYLAWFAAIIISISLVWLIFIFRSTSKKSKTNKVQTNNINNPKSETFTSEKTIFDPLKGLQNQLELSDQQKFYSLLQSNLRSFLGDKLSISPSSRTNSVIFEELKTQGVDPEIISKIKTNFSVCEQVLYAGQDKSAMMHLMIEYVKEIKHSFA